MAASAQPTTQPNNSPVAPGSTPTKLADGFSFTEGPASDPEGNIYFTDQPNDKILKWTLDGKVSVWLEPAGRSNGLCFDDKGNLIACADGKNELWSIAPDKTVTVLMKDYNGKFLNGPNDVWVRPDGGLYFTDPLYARNYWTHRTAQMQQDLQGVFYMSPDRKTIKRVVEDMQQPNGIIGTPDGKTLYVADYTGRKTFSFTINEDGSLSDKKLFANTGSDGMTIDSEGNVYTTGNNLTIWDKTGIQVAQFRLRCTNVCFGGKDHQMLFITANREVYGLQMKTKGVGNQ